MRTERPYKILLVLLFLIIIYSLFILFIVKEPVALDMEENRSLKTLPSLNLSYLDAFPGEYDEYVNDQFPFRKKTIDAYNDFMLKHFQISPVPDKVILGKDGWLFLSGRQLDTYLGKNLFSEKELEYVEKELEYRAKYCRDKDIKFYFVIVPQKHTIYGEYLPYYHRNTIGLTLRTQIKVQLSGNEIIHFIDLTEELKSKKEKELIFYKTDNHWNDLGAFYATSLIVNEIKKDFPAIQSLQLEDYILSWNKKEGGNLAGMISNSTNFSDEEPTLKLKIPGNAQNSDIKHYDPPEGFPYPKLYEQVTVNPDAPPIKVLVIRESFALAQTQFMQLPFRNVVYIWDSWQFGRNEEIIENEDPDIVILQIYEGLLKNLSNNKSSV